MGATGIDDDGGLAVAAMLEQVEDLAPCLFQAVRRDIFSEHLRGQFEQDHQRIGRALASFFQALPAGPDQGHDREQPGQSQSDPRQLAVAAIAAAQEHGMEVGGQDHLPAPGAFLPVPELEQQPGEQWQND
ncbi:hypothetical protein D3C77_460910 [compost metagenome]